MPILKANDFVIQGSSHHNALIQVMWEDFQKTERVPAGRFSKFGTSIFQL